MTSKFFLRGKSDRRDSDLLKAGPTGGLVPIISDGPSESSGQDGQRRSVMLGMRRQHRRKSLATSAPNKTFSLQMLPGDVDEYPDEFPDPSRPPSKLRQTPELWEASGAELLTVHEENSHPAHVAFDLPSPIPSVSVSVSRQPSTRPRSSTAPSTTEVIELPGSLLQENQGFPSGTSPPPSPLTPLHTLHRRSYSDQRVGRAHVLSMLFPPETTAGPTEPDLTLPRHGLRGRKGPADSLLSPKNTFSSDDDLKDLQTALFAQKATITSLNTQVSEIQSTHDAKVAKLDEKHAEDIAQLKAYTAELESRVSVYRLSEIIESPISAGQSPEPVESSYELFPEKESSRRARSEPRSSNESTEWRQERDHLRKELDRVAIRHKVAVQYLQEAKDREEMLQETVDGLKMRVADATEDHQALAEEKRALLQEQESMKKRLEVLNRHKLSCDVEDVRAIAKMAEERVSMLEAQLRAAPNTQAVQDNEEISELMSGFLKQIDDLNVIVKQGKTQILRLEEENDLCRIDVENAEHRYEQLVKHMSKIKSQEEAQTTLNRELKGKNVIITKQNTQLLEQNSLVTDLRIKVSQLQDSVHKAKKDSSDFHRLLQLEIRNRANEKNCRVDSEFPPTPEAEYPPDMDRSFEQLKSDLHAKMAKETGVEYGKESKIMDANARVKYLEREVEHLLRDLVAHKREASDPKKARKQSSKANLRESIFQDFHNPFSTTSVLGRKLSNPSARTEKRGSHEGKEKGASMVRPAVFPMNVVTTHGRGTVRAQSEPTHNPTPPSSRGSPSPPSHDPPAPPSHSLPPPPSHDAPAPPPPTPTTPAPVSTERPEIPAKRQQPPRQRSAEQAAPSTQAVERKKSLPQLQKRLPPTPDARDPVISRQRSIRQAMNRPQRPFVTPISIGPPSPLPAQQPPLASAPTRHSRPHIVATDHGAVPTEANAFNYPPSSERNHKSGADPAMARRNNPEQTRSKHEHARSRSMNTFGIHTQRDMQRSRADTTSAFGSSAMEAMLSPVKVVFV